MQSGWEEWHSLCPLVNHSDTGQSQISMSSFMQKRADSTFFQVCYSATTDVQHEQQMADSKGSTLLMPM